MRHPRLPDARASESESAFTNAKRKKVTRFASVGLDFFFSSSLWFLFFSLKAVSRLHAYDAGIHPSETSLHQTAEKDTAIRELKESAYRYSNGARTTEIKNSGIARCCRRTGGGGNLPHVHGVLPLADTRKPLRPSKCFIRHKKKKTETDVNTCTHNSRNTSRHGRRYTH